MLCSQVSKALTGIGAGKDMLMHLHFTQVARLPHSVRCMQTGKLLMHKRGLPSCPGAESIGWEKAELGPALPL